MAALGSPGAAPRKPPARRRTVLISLLVALGVFLLGAVLAAGYTVGLARTFEQKSTRIGNAFPDEATRPVKAAEATSVNILLMGTDAGMKGASGGNENLPGVPNGGRSDTLALVHLDADRRNVYVMSIMRDTWTEIPGHGEHKINAALPLGGPALVVETVENLFQARIDHVAVIDVEGFKAITDALGGVEINNPTAFTSRHSPQYFPVGVQTLNGESALAFVRERYAFARGDYTRVKNQQLFAKALLARILDRDTLANPVRILDVVTRFAPYISVDDGLDAVTAGSLVLGLGRMGAENVHLFTLPTLGTGRSADGQSIVLKDPAAVREISAALASDTMAGYLAARPAGP